MTRYRFENGRRVIADAGKVLGTCAACHRGLSFEPSAFGRSEGLEPIRLAGILPTKEAWAIMRRKVVAARHGGTFRHSEPGIPLDSVNRRLEGI